MYIRNKENVYDRYRSICMVLQIICKDDFPVNVIDKYALASNIICISCSQKRTFNHIDLMDEMHFSKHHVLISSICVKCLQR